MSAKTANLYKEDLEFAKTRIKGVLGKLDPKNGDTGLYGAYSTAEVTYLTWENAKAILEAVDRGTSELQALLDIKLPALQTFENTAMEEKFRELTAAMRK